MNSSLIVPAFIAVAVTAAVGIFFSDGLFSGGATKDAKEYAVSQTQVKESAGKKATPSVGSDFSWDEESSDTSSPSPKVSESFVSTKPSGDAPGALHTSDDGQSDLYDAVDNVATYELDSSDNTKEVKNESPFDLARSPHEVVSRKDEVDGLGDFFTPSSKSKSPVSAPTSHTISEMPFASKPTAVAKPSALTKSTAAAKQKAPVASANDSFDTQVVAVSPKAKASDLRVDNFGDDAPSFGNAPAKVNDNMKSVVAADAKKAASPKVSAKITSVNDSAISGDLEPMAGKEDHPPIFDPNGGSKKSVVRKFKITNPKETTLAVTMSIDGKTVTLKPDQSYVITDSDGDVEVTFSRGGSFGFYKKTIKTGHYRFSVSRETGWQLLN